MRNIISSAIFLLFFVQVPSQGQKIEPSMFECRYKLYMQTDTIHRLNFIIDEMVLRIGKTRSQFFSWHTFYHDSLWADTNGRKLAEELTLEAFRTRDYSKMPTIKTTRNYIYKNYPKGKITTTAKDFKVNCIYDEDYQSQDWIIQDSTKQCVGYTCRKAVCTFRGRHWTVWFAPDIPIEDGPWKLKGLPGLILEAYDSSKDYHYVAIKMKTKDINPVMFYRFDNKPELKVERKKYLSSLNKFLRGFPTEEVELIQIITRNNRNQAFMPKTKRDIRYDFLERDY